MPYGGKLLFIFVVVGFCILSFLSVLKLPNCTAVELGGVQVIEDRLLKLDDQSRDGIRLSVKLPDDIGICHKDCETKYVSWMAGKHGINNYREILYIVGALAKWFNRTLLIPPIRPFKWGSGKYEDLWDREALGEQGIRWIQQKWNNEDKFLPVGLPPVFYVWPPPMLAFRDKKLWHYPSDWGFLPNIIPNLFEEHWDVMTFLGKAFPPSLALREWGNKTINRLKKNGVNLSETLTVHLRFGDRWQCIFPLLDCENFSFDTSVDYCPNEHLAYLAARCTNGGLPVSYHEAVIRVLESNPSIKNVFIASPDLNSSKVVEFRKAIFPHVRVITLPDNALDQESLQSIEEYGNFFLSGLDMNIAIKSRLFIGSLPSSWTEDVVLRRMLAGIPNKREANLLYKLFVERMKPYHHVLVSKRTKFVGPHKS